MSEEGAVAGETEQNELYGFFMMHGHRAPFINMRPFLFCVIAFDRVNRDVELYSNFELYSNHCKLQMFSARRTHTVNGNERQGTQTVTVFASAAPLACCCWPLAKRHQMQH